MALEINQILPFLILAIFLNVAFYQFASVGVIDCPNLADKYQEGNYTVENVTSATETYTKANNYINLILNRCDNFPAVIFWLVQIPIIISLLSLVRSFIGLT